MALLGVLQRREGVWSLENTEAERIIEQLTRIADALERAHPKPAPSAGVPMAIRREPVRDARGHLKS